MRRILSILAALAIVALLPASVLAQSKGVNKDYMDTTCQPCKDFYRYANGKWIDTAEIPASYTGIGAGREIFDRNQEALYRVLEKARAKAATETDPTLKKLGDLYTVLMDSTRTNSEGAAALAETMKRLDGIKTKEDLRKEFSRAVSMGVGAGFVGAGLPFTFGAEPDPKQSTMTLGQIFQGGLGLPERDYYFRTDGKSDTLRQDYLAYMGHMFQLAGDSPEAAAAKAKQVMALETTLAESSMTRVAMRDPQKLYHKISVKDLGQLAPTIDWSAYFTEVGVPALAKPAAMVDCSAPGFVRQVGIQVDQTPIDVWRAYLEWHYLRAAAPWLDQKFFDESFAFQSKLVGTKSPLPRWKRASGAVDASMGEALGKAFVEENFPASSKARMVELVNNLQGAYRERIDQVTWMSPATKKQAVVKLDAIMKKIGYPDKWRDYSALQIDVKAPAIVNLWRAQAFESRRDLAKIGKAPDRTEWGMTPPTVNAYYNPQFNEIVFPAGILQPPQFDPNVDDAVNYGAIGMVIGHEITHGFDDEGRQYDSLGNLKDWWTDEDAKQFTARAQKVVDQFNGYVAVDTLHVNGKLTLGENIADLGGLTIAYHAWQRSLKGKPAPQSIDGFTPEQRFFLGYAQGWRRKLRPELIRLATLTDPHSPANWRVNGPTSNMREFQKAFGCKAGDDMVRPDDVRAEIW